MLDKLVLFLIYISFGIIYQAYGQERPNFVFILTDDQSYGMMGCTGNNIVSTPNLDQLAQEGVIFDNAHITSAICTPSRISMLLSQFERKHGVNFNSGTSVSEKAWEQSYPMIMRKEGYYTGWIGKNHAPVGVGGYESGLMEESFDYWYAGHGHLSFYPKEKHNIFYDALHTTQVELVNEGVNDFMDPNERKLKGAIRFLEDRPAAQPFMLSINLNLPHSNGTGSMKQLPEDDEIYKTLYRDVDIPLPSNYIARADIVNPKLPVEVLKAENRQTGYNFVDTPDKLRERYIRQLQSMTGIDRMVGNIRKKLKELHLADNTIIIFTSDHGLFMGEHGLGGKALCYEKTTHVPLIIFDPKLVTSRRGARNNALVQSIDIAPTMLVRAKIDIPSSFQGKDLSGLINGNGNDVRNYLFTENLWSTGFGNPRCESIQNKEWKYIRYYKNDNFPALKKIEAAKQLGLTANKLLYGVHDNDMALYRDFIESSVNGERPVYEELYHLKKDPTESDNLIEEAKHALVLSELKSAWERKIKDARAEGEPMVERYTVGSKAEFKKAHTYKADWNSLQQHQIPQWLKDAKFGIYTHLSLQTIKNIPGNEQRMLHDLIPEFKLENFDAVEWANLFERAGAKFAGPVAWHGSGFLHWDSDITNFNTMDMGPKIDIVGSLKKEIGLKNMKFITSYHTGYWYQAAVREKDDPAYLDPQYEDLYGPVHDTHVTDAIKWKNHIEKQKKFSEHHMTALLSKMNEAINKYEPDITWVDVSFGGTVRGVNKGRYKNGKLIGDNDPYMGGIKEKYQADYIANFYNMGEATDKEVEFVYKEHDVPPGVGMRNIENGLLDELAYDVWMTDIDICDPTSWFYKEDLKLKSANVLIDILVDVVSKNGVLLLNVPPKPDGSFADFIKDELYEIGDWLDINGEAIYGTIPWVTFGEGPTVLKKTGHYSERHPNAIYTEKDIRFTQRNNALYAICLGWPGEEVNIRSLGSRGKLFNGDIISIELLGSDHKLAYTQSANELNIKLPMDPVNEHAIVFKIERDK